MLRHLFALAMVLLSRPGAAHTLYLANDNHTDCGWNATVAVYEASMLSELDYWPSSAPERPPLR